MADLATQWDRRLGAIKRLAEAAHAQAKKNEGSNTPLEEGSNTPLEEGSNTPLEGGRHDG
jgi:hypothetical protein